MIGNRDELTANKSITQNIILCNGGPMEKNRRMRDILRTGQISVSGTIHSEYI